MLHGSSLKNFKAFQGYSYKGILLFQKNGHDQIKACTAANWVDCLMDKRLMTKNCTIVEGNLVI